MSSPARRDDRTSDGPDPLDALVLDARDALTHATGGTLHVDGDGSPANSEGWAPDTSASFYDDAGTPTFFAPAGSPVARAAERSGRAVLSVPLGSLVADADSLVLAGRLRALRRVEDGAVVVVTLELTAVVLERDAPPAPVSHRVLPLPLWTQAEPDPVRLTARRLVEHTNDAHAAAVRSYVAGLRAIAESDVVAAELADLDAAGFDVRWIDARGAHTTHVRFPQPARCPRSLTAALRTALLD